jgi:type I restriction enzyme S subunit
MRDGWVETTFGEAVVINPEAAKGMADDDEIVYVDLSSVSAESGISSDLYRGSFGEAPGRARRVIRTQDVLVSTVRPYLRGFALVPEFLDGEIASTGFAVLRAKPSRILPGLVWAIVGMNNFVDYLMDRATGSSYPAVRPDDVSSFSFFLPPLDEQKRIVDVVSSVNAYIEALQQQVHTTRAARNAVLHELLSAGGDDWTETTLGEVAEASWGNTTVTKKQYKESGFTAFSASGPDGFVDWFEHDGEGVVLSAIGALCGKTWLADGKWTPIKNTIWIKSKSEDCLTGFLYLVSKMPDLWPIRGQAQSFISLGDVRLVEVSLPPLVVQKRIVEVVSSMDEVINSSLQAVFDAKVLRSGLLSDLLSGEHEIPASYDSLLGAA